MVGVTLFTSHITKGRKPTSKYGSLQKKLNFQRNKDIMSTPKRNYKQRHYIILHKIIVNPRKGSRVPPLR